METSFSPDGNICAADFIPLKRPCTDTDIVIATLIKY
jgi:hypothetical protein